MCRKNVFFNSRIYNFEKDFEAVFYRPGWGGTPLERKYKYEKAMYGKSKQYAENRQRTIQKAKSKVRRLIKSYSLDRFITLTFAENLKDVKKTDHEFRKFMKRVRRRYPKFKYVAVREFQQRGAVHYHLAVNTFIEHKELETLWGNGFVWVEKKVNTANQLSNYLSKYITKDAGDERLKGLNTYLCSHGMKIDYQDRDSDSFEDLCEYLRTIYGETFDEKKVIHFPENNLFWIG